MDWISLLGAIEGADKALGPQGGDVSDVLGVAGSALGLPAVSQAAQVAGAAENPEGALVDYGLTSVAEGTERDAPEVGPDPMKRQREEASQILQEQEQAPEPVNNAPVAFTQDPAGAPGLGVFRYADGTEKTSYDPELAGSLPSPEALQTDATATDQTPAVVPETQPEASQEPVESAMDAYQQVQQTRMQNALETKQRIEERAQDKLEDIAAQETAAIQRQEQQEAAAEEAEKAAKEVAESEIDPSRAWTNLPAFGKVMAIMTLAATPFQNLGQVVAPMIGYLNSDIEAQKSDRNSRYNHWKERLKSEEAAEAATRAELIQSAQARHKVLDEKAGASGLPGAANEANAMLEVERQKAIDTVKQQMFENTLAERRMQVAEGQLGVQRSRLALDRQRAAGGGASSASQLWKEIQAKHNLEQFSRTGMTPDEIKQLELRTEKLATKMDPLNELTTGLDRVFATTGITRDERGRLVAPDDIPNKGVFDAVISKPVWMPDWDERRIAADRAIDNVVDIVARDRTGAVINDEEAAKYQQLLGDTKTEGEFFAAIQEFDRFLQQRIEDVARSAGDQTLAEYYRRGERDAPRRAAAKKVTGKIEAP